MNSESIERREFLRGLLRWGLVGALGTFGFAMLRRRSSAWACPTPAQCAGCSQRAGCPQRRSPQGRQP